MRRSWLKEKTGRVVLFHFKDADSIEGIVVREWEDGIELVRARMIKSGGAATEMGGETFIPRDQLFICQHGE